MRIGIKVIPNAKKEEVILNGKTIEEGIIVRVKSPPEKGKANKEVVEILEKYFNKKVRIIQGNKSREKVIEI